MSNLCFNRLYTSNILNPLITPAGVDELKKSVGLVKKGVENEWSNLLSVVVSRTVGEIIARARLTALCDLIVVGLRVGGDEGSMDRGVRWLTGVEVFDWSTVKEMVLLDLSDVSVEERRDGTVDLWGVDDVIGMVEKTVKREVEEERWGEGIGRNMVSCGVNEFCGDMAATSYFHASLKRSAEEGVEEYKGIVGGELGGKEPVGKVMGKMERWRRGIRGEERGGEVREERIQWVWREFVKYKEICERTEVTRR